MKYLLCWLFLFCIKGYGGTKGRVLHTSPQQALPILKEDRSHKNALLDFKTVKTSWLSKYPVIQKEIRKIIQSERQAILKDAKELFKEFPNSALLPYRLSVEELKLFQPANKDIVSVRMRLYTYTGGAHGGSQYYSWNYSQKQKRFLFLEDIFPPSDYCAQLVMVGRKPLFQKKPLKECASQAGHSTTALRGSEKFLTLILDIRDLLFEHRKQGSEYDKHIKADIIRGTMENRHFKIWNLNPSGIIFLFPEYQVGPYSAGRFEVFVPLKI